MFSWLAWSPLYEAHAEEWLNFLDSQEEGRDRQYERRLMIKHEKDMRKNLNWALRHAVGRQRTKNPARQVFQPATDTRQNLTRAFATRHCLSVAMLIFFVTTTR